MKVTEKRELRVRTASAAEDSSERERIVEVYSNRKWGEGEGEGEGEREGESESYVAAVEQEINKYHRNLRVLYMGCLCSVVCICFP